MGEPVKLNGYESAVLSFVTKELLNGKRPHELLLLKLLLEKEQVSQEEFEKNCMIMVPMLMKEC